MTRLALIVVAVAANAFGGEWKAGAAKTPITPAKPMWMSGYGSRDHAAEGTLHELWCKALALESPGGARAVVISLDLVGVSKDLSDRASAQITEKLGIPRAAIMIATSHTHTGPMTSGNLELMFDLSAEEQQKIRDYTQSLEAKIVQTVADAVGRLGPARLSWANGAATFAVNRRNNVEANVPQIRGVGELKGPVDYEVPVLCVRAPDGKIRSVVFGYACHATVLSFYQWSGDYPGFAMMELEKSHPDAVALFFAGCGADQNPLPRRTVELAEQYGRELAESVDEVLYGTMNPVGDRFAAKFAILDLPLDTLPTPDQMVKLAESGNAYEKRLARVLLDRLNKGGSLQQKYPYPIQVWHVGGDLTWVALGGEVVVDYSVRLKRELAPGRTWVAGYCNDVMAYIPSLRVLKEGGYEGASSMVLYGHPTKWAPSVEELIVAKVHELARQPAGANGTKGDSNQ